MATKAACRAVTTAMAIAGRGARACDVCAGKSARWYCGADTAYLCDRCDTQVHSANSLSLRHERVRLTPSGAPAAARKPTTDSSPPPCKRSMSKILHAPVPQVLPCRKRSRTTRPHPHHRHQHQNQPQQEHQDLQLFKPLNPDPPKGAPKQSTEAEELHELLTFDDLFDTEDFLIVDDDDTHEVPSFITVSPQSPQSPPSSTELGSTEQLESSSFDAFSPDFHAVSSPSEDSNFAAYFKGKAALDDDVMSDHVLVPENGFDAEGDPLACDAAVDVDEDGGITLTGEACFIPGEIPDLDGFEEFGSRELGSLSFDLEPSPDDTASESSPSNVAEPEIDRFACGPFAKFFASRPKPESATNAHPLSPESMKSEAKEILRCCREGQSEEDLRTVPSLQLNYDDVITAWSDRGEPWVHPDGLVPDMGNGDDDPNDGGREARVLRYKEKRRSRLFSKTIRYEVRKLNAERRPRMKGRFVKRTPSNS